MKTTAANQAKPTQPLTLKELRLKAFEVSMADIRRRSCKVGEEMFCDEALITNWHTGTQRDLHMFETY